MKIYENLAKKKKKDQSNTSSFDLHKARGESTKLTPSKEIPPPMQRQIVAST